MKFLENENELSLSDPNVKKEGSSPFESKIRGPGLERSEIVAEQVEVTNDEIDDLPKLTGTFRESEMDFNRILQEKERNINKIVGEYMNLEKHAHGLEEEIKELKEVILQLETEKKASLTRWWLFWQMMIKSLKYPGRVLSHLNTDNLTTLVFALREEKPPEILYNFRKLLGEIEEVDDLPIHDSLKERFTQEQKRKLLVFLRSNDKIYLGKVSNPVVSIVIVLYNRVELTLSCLESINQTVEFPFEVIIVDNASTDATHKLLRRVRGAKIIRNKSNKGFLLASNQAARKARGKHLLFLNNDAQLMEGSIQTALETLESQADIGAVGGRIILLDGTLQEAGSMVWDNGSCLGYGRGQAPEQPEFMFRRDVDYCSGVFLLTPRKLFDELGGFDEAYVPAYYEETDYCMRLWQAEYRVVYEPMAKIIHFEFASSANSEAAFTLQRSHRKIFFEKHKSQLSRHYSVSTQQINLARFAIAQKHALRILFIEDKIPHIDEGAGFPRSNQILHHMVDLGLLVSVLPINFPDKDDWETAYKDLPREIELLIGIGSQNLIEFVASRSGYYDVIWVSRPHNLQFFKDHYYQIEHLIRESKIVYDSEAIFSNRDLAYAHLMGDYEAAARYEIQLKDELQLASLAHIVVAVNEAEAEQFRQAIDVPTYVSNIVFSIDATSGNWNLRSGLLFVGNMDHDGSPNVDSITWLVEEVYPYIADRMKTPDLTLVGSNNSPQIQTLAEKHQYIKLIGQVDDLKPHFESCRLFVAPTRFSAGVPLKVLQASAYGVPVVCTDLIQSQLGWNKEEALMSAPISDPALYAEKICGVYQNEKLSENLINGAFIELKRRFSLDEQKLLLKSILDSCSDIQVVNL
ncbi:MAG: glycosyltransferase [Saprospiraceae bacterium]|nr:glycosyltransferase [Saprospiraceae bacterium]